MTKLEQAKQQLATADAAGLVPPWMRSLLHAYVELPPAAIPDAGETIHKFRRFLERLDDEVPVLAGYLRRDATVEFVDPYTLRVTLPPELRATVETPAVIARLALTAKDFGAFVEAEGV